jgi:hypothetical protein
MRYHNLCSVHRRSILAAACKTQVGELFGANDGDDRRPFVRRFVEIVMICRVYDTIPAQLASEIFPMLSFWNFDDIGVYSEILAAHSEMIADERNILDGDELDREVAAFA